MIPREVNILGRTYKIRQKQMKDYGLCDYDNKCILLKTGMSTTQREETILHEVLHAILYESGIGFKFDTSTEEAVVRALEHGLYQAGFKRITE